MATREEELISAAIASTENEIFSEAFGQKEPVLDETGDRSVEQMGEGLEGQHEPDEDEPDSDDDAENGEESDGDGEEDGEGEGEEEQEGEGEEDGDGEDQQEDEAEPETEPPPEQAAKRETKPDTKPDGRVPSGRLREQSDRADRAETALRTANEERERERAEFNRRFDEMNGRFNTLMTALQGGQRPGALPQPQPQPQGAPPDAPPDVFENPQGFVEYQNRQRQSDMSRVEQMFANMRFQNSVDIARSIHKEKFDAAWDAVNKLSADKPDELAVARQIYNAPNPGAEIMKWHARNETLRIVGDDPAKYRETVANELREALMKDPEFRKQLLDNLRVEATGDDESKPKRTITRLPKSLNGATGQSHQKDSDPTLYDDSDSAVFNSAWR